MRVGFWTTLLLTALLGCPASAQTLPGRRLKVTFPPGPRMLLLCFARMRRVRWMSGWRVTSAPESARQRGSATGARASAGFAASRHARWWVRMVYPIVQRTCADETPRWDRSWS